MTPTTMQTERDFICQVIYQRTSTYKAIYIAMKEFPGNNLPSLDLAKRDYHSVICTWSHCQEQWYRVCCIYYSLFQPVSYFHTVCFSQYDILQRSSQWNFSCCIYQWQVEAAWLNGTLWGQEFLANWNLLLGTGPRRLCQKMNEKKGDLMITHCLWCS